MFVFMVEDDEYISRVFERAFRLGGHTIALAMDGKMALEDLGKMNPLPDAIILDVVMPEMRGEEFLQRIRADQRYVHIPVLILTNSVHADKGPKYIAMGADEYLIKIEHTPKEIISRIEALIKKKAAAPDAA